MHLLTTDWLGALTVADGAALLLSSALVVWFYVCRHASYAWLLQDLMALAMCCMFLRTIRLPNVRVAAVLLSVFFLYDIFMVFLSPLIFRKSVMVEVATAGAGGEARQQLSGDGRTCAHIAGERMPVLFMVPRIDFGGGYAMLGLGDVVMPGLLVCFALRYDCAMRLLRQHGGGGGGGGCCARGPSYFVIVAIGYAVGLLLALLANVFGLTFNGVRGQPALLYLVPCTLLPIMLAAALRGELREMWQVEGLDVHTGAYEAHGEEAGRQDSAEPYSSLSEEAGRHEAAGPP
ncbi:peptidase A22B, signal peptide peptidase [Pavlovales sp. CCMP2436]|nr:peptidase A22B, signal peptide peptidase [Pavlovales sp. CCMP2436]